MTFVLKGLKWLVKANLQLLSGSNLSEDLGQVHTLLENKPRAKTLESVYSQNPGSGTYYFFLSCR